MLVYFEYRNESLLLARRARLRRRLDPRHPRRRTRAGGRQADAVRRLPRLDARPRRRGVHARRDRARLHARRPGARARARRRSDRRLVPRPVRPREGGGPRDQGRRRHRLPRRARDRDLGRARARAVGRAAVGDRRLAVTAWFTVLQRILHVRRELRARAS